MKILQKAKPLYLLFVIQTLLLILCILGYMYAIPHWQTYKSDKLKVTFNYPTSWFVKDYVDIYGFIVVSPDPIQEGVYSEKHIRLGLNKCTNTTTKESFPCEKTVAERVTLFQNIYPHTFKQHAVIIHGRKMIQIEGGYPEENGRRYQKDTVFPDHSYLLVVSAGSYEQKITDIYNKLVNTVTIF